MFGLSLAKFVFMHQSSPLNKFICTQNSARFLFLSCAHTLFWSFGTKWRGKREEREDVFLFLREHKIYLLNVHKPLLYWVFRIWKRWECSGLERRSALTYCESCLREKWQNKWILKKPTTRTKWTRNSDVPLGISNNGKHNTKIVSGCLNLTASGFPFFDLSYPPWSHLQQSKLFIFPPSFPPFFRRFGQQKPQFAIISLLFTIKFE